MLKLGLIQMRCSINREENIDRAEAKVREAAARGAKIICLPEIFTTIYFCQIEDHKYFKLAEEIPGPTIARFQTLAAEIDAAIVAPLFEKRAAGLYHNSAAIIDAGGSYLGKYRKMHIPDDPLFYEKFYFTPGDLGFRSWKTQAATIGVLICWDQWYPEGARLTALRGAEILSIRQPSAGILPKRGCMARANMHHGRQFNVATRLPTAVSLRCRIALDLRHRTAVMESSSGVKVLLPILRGRSSPKQVWIRKRCLLRKSICHWWTSNEPIGPSCVTGG